MAQNVWDLCNISPVFFQAIFTIRFFQLIIYPPPNRFSYYIHSNQGICCTSYSNKDMGVPFPPFRPPLSQFPQMPPWLHSSLSIPFLRNYYSSLSKGHNADKIDSPTQPYLSYKLHFIESPLESSLHCQPWNLIVTSRCHILKTLKNHSYKV